MNQPWYLRILENQGISTFLIVLIVMYGGKTGGMIAQRHLQFLDSQEQQMKLQTDILKTIAASNSKQEDGLRNITDSLDKGIKDRQSDNEKIMELLKKEKP